MSRMHTIRKLRQYTAANTKSRQISGKERLTISLSRENIRFLRTHCCEKGATSVSAYVERLVTDAQARAKLEELAAQTTLYYDSLAVKEAAELSAWGELGESALDVRGE